MCVRLRTCGWVGGWVGGSLCECVCVYQVFFLVLIFFNLICVSHRCVCIFESLRYKKGTKSILCADCLFIRVSLFLEFVSLFCCVCVRVCVCVLRPHFF